MKVKLTDRFCSHIKADSRVDYFDEVTTGLALRVTEQGSKSWTYNFTIATRRARMTLGTYPALSLSAARTKAIEARAEVEAGNDPRLTPAEGTTLKAVCEDYLAREGKTLRTLEERKSTLNRLVYPALGHRPIGEIRRSEIVQLMDDIEDNSGPVMADRTLEVIRRIMSWHASRTDDFNSPIVRGMARAKSKDRARKRVLTDDELRAVWKVASEHEAPFDYLVQFILLTATRRNEASEMNRAELHGSDWVIPGARMKEELEHLIPLSSAALALLGSIPVRGENGWFFCSVREDVPICGFSIRKKEFDRKVIAELRRVALERNDRAMLQRLDEIVRLMAAPPEDKEAKAKLKQLWYTIHDLRRTARTLMSRAGVNPDHAERCLAHTLPSIRGTYDLYEFKEEKAKAFEALAALISRIVNPQDNVVTLSKAV
jgi:integrase